MKELPNFISEENYDTQKIQNLLSSGNLQSSADAFGTLNISQNEIDPSSSLEDHLLLIPMEKINVVPPQVETYAATEVVDYASDVEIQEEDNFEEDEELQTLENEVEEAINNEQILQAQIDELSSKLDEEMQKNVKFREDSASMYLAARDTIVTQRINSGEGNSPDDFQDVFPFLPKKSDERDKSAERVENFPFMGIGG
tara:strand:+ start:95 stop:691 length:597 start_codon:yes stop_codon:yes gene_type:complete